MTSLYFQIWGALFRGSGGAAGPYLGGWTAVLELCRTLYQRSVPAGGLGLTQAPGCFSLGGGGTNWNLDHADERQPGNLVHGRGATSSQGPSQMQAAVLHDPSACLLSAVCCRPIVRR